MHMIEIIHKDGEPRKSSKSVMIIRASESNLVKAPDSTKAKPLIIEGVIEKPSSLNLKPPVLVVNGLSKDVMASPESSKVVVPGIPNKPVVVVKGAPATPIIIKPVTQLPVVDAKAVLWNYKQVMVTYKGKEIKEEVNETGGLTRSGRCFTPEELRKAKPLKDSPMPVKKSVTDEEAEEFLKKMKVQDYSIMEQLRKTPAQISLLSLLIHSDEHRKALIKILNEAHVPDKITVNHLEKIAGKIFEANRITFSDDKLPMEGTEHNRALYLTVKCEDSVVSRVLVDNGFSANICLLSTLQKLKIGTERIHLNSVCVRGFDGGGKDSVGDIMLELSIGPVEFTMEFQVLDVAVSYNLLLGRPWIHTAKAVPSSLHQMVKFEWDRHELVVHGDEDLSACNDTIVPLSKLKMIRDLGSIRLSKQCLLRKFLKENAFQGIVHPVHPSGNPGTFGLGFMPTEKEPNLSETEAINLGDQDDVRETKISVHLEPQVKEEIIKTLFEYKDVFAWSYDDMTGLSTDLVVHKLQTDPAFPLVKKKLRKFKTDMSVKIKEEITKQLTAKSDHVKDLRKFFQRLCRYNLKLNLAKCEFGVPSGKLLGFVVSRCGIELDPSKIKAIQELPPPKNKTELLKKNVAVKWTDECQEAFDKIKRYLSNPPVLVPPEPGRPLILYQTVLDNSFGCVLGQHDVTRKKEQAIYYLSKKFTPYEVMCVDEVDHNEKPGWKLFFDGAANMKGVGIGAVLISETGQYYPITTQLRFYCTNNMVEYEACILGLRLAIDMGVQEILVLGDSELLVYQIQGEWETRDLKLIPYRQCLHDLCQ
ncbi:uncharacterized protein [Nicotiana sylvestris]|uniref:uncharacterized protein n=1 Tax=Nicotiana sylvestris TaxID=4096 RepID=UPI00388CCF39